MRQLVEINLIRLSQLRQLAAQRSKHFSMYMHYYVHTHVGIRCVFAWPATKDCLDESVLTCRLHYRTFVNDVLRCYLLQY